MLNGNASVCLCVCLLETTVSPAKAAEPIEILFGMHIRAADGATYYMGARIPRGKGHYRGHVPDTPLGYGRLQPSRLSDATNGVYRGRQARRAMRATATYYYGVPLCSTMRMQRSASMTSQAPSTVCTMNFSRPNCNREMSPLLPT